MIILIVEAKLGKRVCLTQERWNHMVSKHPAVADKLGILEQTLATPDVIIFTESAWIYQRRYNHQYFTVILDTDKRFIITAYISERIKQGEIIWKA